MCQELSHLTLLRPISQLSQSPQESGCTPCCGPQSFQQPLPVSSFSHFLVPPSRRGASWLVWCVNRWPRRPWTEAVGFPRRVKSPAECQGPCLVSFSPVALCHVHSRLVSPGQLDRLHRGKEWDFPPTCGPQCASPGLSAISEGIWCWGAEPEKGKEHHVFSGWRILNLGKSPPSVLSFS